MAHQRKLIRDAVVAMLVAANTAAADRVTGSRVDPLEPSELPTLSVYTLSEDVDSNSVTNAPRRLDRHLKLEIAGWVAHSDQVSVDDAMDALAEQIEAAMDSDRYLRSTCGESILESCEMSIVEEDGRSDPLVGVVTLTYAVTYRTWPATAATPDDFNTVDSTQKPAGGANDTPVVEDTFVVQETSP